jgi:hypothetical protein
MRLLRALVFLSLGLPGIIALIFIESREKNGKLAV